MANFITQIRQVLGKYIGGFRSSRTNIWGISSQEIYAPIEQDTAVSKGFDSNTAVYSIVKKYAKKAASIEKYLENKKDDTEMEDHPLMKLLNRPNPKQSQYAFFKTVYAFYKVCGEAFIWLNRGDVTQVVDEQGNIIDRTPEQIITQPVLEMYVIPSNEIVIIPDKDDPFAVAGYYLRNRPEVKFTGVDIIHWMDLNLDWDEFSRPQMRGMTPLRPGFKTLAADNSFIDSMVRMAQNDGAKGALVNKTIGATMNPKQQAQLDLVIKDKINNKDVKNAVAALEGDWNYLDFGLTAVDMDTLNAREFIYKEMCFLLDVPYGFFDSHTPYAEKQLAARDWISNSIKPDCNELDGELQRALFPAFNLKDSQAQICSNFDSLPELQEDKSKQADWLGKIPITPNEFREAMEYETISDPVMDEVRMPGTSSSIMAEPDLTILDAQNMSDAANGAGNRTNGTYKVPHN